MSSRFGLFEALKMKLTKASPHPAETTVDAKGSLSGALCATIYLLLDDSYKVLTAHILPSLTRSVTFRKSTE